MPSQSCVHNAIWLVVGYLSVGIGVGACTVLETVVQVQVQLLPEVGLQMSHQLVSQVLQGVLALYAVGLHFVLVNVAVGYVQLFQYMLRRHQLLQVQRHGGFQACGIHLGEVHRLPRCLGVVAATNPVNQVPAVVAIHAH